MSDLFSSLREPEQLPTPPASEVRRRGDSLRRRRQALQGAGVAAAVAAVALAALGVSGGFSSSSEPPIATRPTSAASTSASPADRITTIPTGIDLAQGLEGGSADELNVGPDVRWLSDLVICDADHSFADTETDHVAAVRRSTGLTEARDLRVFPSDRAASDAAGQLVGAFRACPSFSLDDGASQTVNTVTEVDLGASPGWQVSQTYVTDGEPQVGENLLHVVLVGNAVLVTQWYADGPGATDPAASRSNADDQVEQLRPLVLELECTFGNAGGC